MSALRSMLLWDVRLQVRYGFYAVYAVLTVAFVVGLRTLALPLRTDATVLLVVTDPTVLGFYFVAAIVLFEREEAVLDALVLSPLGERGYLLSKLLSLSALAVVTSTVVAVVGHGMPRNLPVLVVGVALSSALFVLVGFVAVARFDSINEYFLSAVGWGTVLFLPLAGYVGLFETDFFYLLPVRPVLLLVEAGFRPLPAWQIGYGVGYLTVANVVAFHWARRSFRRHVVRGGDPGRQFGRETVSSGRTAGEWVTLSSPVVGLVLTDLRNWTRDPLLIVAAAGPLALALAVRFGTPTIEPMAAPVVTLPEYYPVVVGALSVFGPAIYGFVVGMFLLEDREQGVLAAYRVSPLAGRGYLLYRCLTAYVLSVGATLPALALVGLVDVPLPVLFGTTAVAALGGPTFALVFGTFASNTIEGIALSKLVNLVVLAPVLVVAVVHTPYQFLTGVFPTYWPVKAVEAGVGGRSIWMLYALVGVGAHALVLVGLGRSFIRQAE